jgi:hypothetical protein
MRHARLAAAMLILTGVAACSSEGDGGKNDNGTIGPINCTGLTGATATGSFACSIGACSVEFHDAAIDGDLGTYATLTMLPNTSGTMSLRATAQDGVSYPAGTPAAVVYGIARTSGDSLNTVESISTYLDGVLQQTSNVTTNGTTSGDVDAGRRAIVTVQPFDAIEVTYSQSSGTAGVEVRAFEFCTSTN